MDVQILMKYNIYKTIITKHVKLIIAHYNTIIIKIHILIMHTIVHMIVMEYGLIIIYLNQNRLEYVEIMKHPAHLKH